MLDLKKTTIKEYYENFKNELSDEDFEETEVNMSNHQFFGQICLNLIFFGLAVQQKFDRPLILVSNGLFQVQDGEAEVLYLASDCEEYEIIEIIDDEDYINEKREILVATELIKANKQIDFKIIKPKVELKDMRKTKSYKEYQSENKTLPARVTRSSGKIKI